MKIGSLWASKIDPENTASLLTGSKFFKGFRYFHTGIIGPLGQRAAKLLAVKVWGLKKKSAFWPWPYSNLSARIWDCPRSNHSQSLMACNFAALSPTDSIFSALKDLNLLKKYTKYQENSNNCRLGFALSNGPHLHRAYLVTVPFDLILAVKCLLFVKKINNVNRWCFGDFYERFWNIAASCNQKLPTKESLEVFKVCFVLHAAKISSMRWIVQNATMTIAGCHASNLEFLWAEKSRVSPRPTSKLLEYIRFWYIQGVLAYHVFRGREETVIGKIRDKQGVF